MVSHCLDIERTLGLLLGLCSKELMHSIPVSDEEDSAQSCLSQDIFSQGMGKSQLLVVRWVGFLSL